MIRPLNKVVWLRLMNVHAYHISLYSPYIFLLNMQPGSHERQYETTVHYSCPSNTSIPAMLTSNFSFDYAVDAGSIYTVQAYCEIDR